MHNREELLRDAAQVLAGFGRGKLARELSEFADELCQPPEGSCSSADTP